VVCIRLLQGSSSAWRWTAATSQALREEAPSNNGSVTSTTCVQGSTKIRGTVCARVPDESMQRLLGSAVAVLVARCRLGNIGCRCLQQLYAEQRVNAQAQRAWESNTRHDTVPIGRLLWWAKVMWRRRDSPHHRATCSAAAQSHTNSLAFHLPSNYGTVEYGENIQ